MKALMDKADFMESKTELMVQVEGPEETGEVKEQVSFKLQTKGWGVRGGMARTMGIILIGLGQVCPGTKLFIKLSGLFINGGSWGEKQTSMEKLWNAG